MNPRFFQQRFLHFSKLFFLIIALSGFLSACGDDITNVTNPAGGGSPAETGLDTGLDTDGDGLSDIREKALGTSPVLYDTDGDGFSDFDEVVTFGFDPSGNPLRFNPLIADTPKITINLLSVPSILINYTETDGTTSSISTSRSQASSSTVTRSKSKSNTNSFEHAYKEGFEIETTVKVAVDGGVETTGQLSFEATQTLKNETTTSWSKEQAAENSTAFENAESFESSHEVSAGNGVISIVASVSNTGGLSYTLRNLILSATYFDHRLTNPVTPVGNLDFDTSSGSFPEVTLAPGQSIGPLNFAGKEINLQRIKQLLSNSQGLTVTPAIFDMLDEEGNSFNFDLTVVQAQDAVVSIDFGSGSDRPPINEWVAVNGDPDAKATVRSVLEKIFGMTVRSPDAGRLFTGLDGVDNVAPDSASDLAGDKGVWVMAYAKNLGGNRFETTVFTTAVQEAMLKAKNSALSNLNPSGVDPMTISLHGGDFLSLTYIQDSDLDGLGDRQEFFHGTDPLLADTDGDGLTDGQEVQGWRVTYKRAGVNISVDVRSDPLNPDTDGDGLSDADEANLGSVDDALRRNPLIYDTDGDGIPDIDDDIDAAGTRLANVFDPTDIQNMSATYGVTVDLEYDLVNVMGTENFKTKGNNIDTYKVLLLRFNNQKGYRNLPDPVPGPIDNNAYQKGTHLPCAPALLGVDTAGEPAASCDWVVVDVFDPVNEGIAPPYRKSVKDNNLTDTTNGSTKEGTGPFKYIAYLQINGDYIRSSQSISAFASAEIIRIRMMGGQLINNRPVFGDGTFDPWFGLFLDGRMLNRHISRSIAFSNVYGSISTIDTAGWDVFANIDPMLKNPNLLDPTRKYTGGGWNFIDTSFTPSGAKTPGVPVFEFSVPAVSGCHEIRVEVGEVDRASRQWQLVSFPSPSKAVILAVDTAILCRGDQAVGAGIWTIESRLPSNDPKAVANGIIGSAPSPTSGLISTTGFSGKTTTVTNSIFPIPIQYQTRKLLWNYFTPTATTSKWPAAQSGDIRIRYDVMVVQ